MGTKKKILLVEDDANLGFVIQDNLAYEGFEVILCKDGDEGFETFTQDHFDVCVLDVMLPKRDGFSLAEAIRETNQMVPIIFLTAKSMQEDRIEGFTKGGDDFITKPFSIEELVLRIKVFIKRSVVTQESPETPAMECAEIGAYHFNFVQQYLEINDIRRSLTKKEANILRLFCAHSGQVLKREFILKEIWGENDYFLGRSLDVFISKLRKYLKDDPKIEIVNYHGVGFQLNLR